MAARQSTNKSTVQVEPYNYPDADNATRPEVGTQARFSLKKPLQTYRYDSSLSPSLEWDGQNPAREQAKALIRQVLDAASLDEAKAAAEKLRRMSGPFLNWAGKAERLSFDVPTLPLFIHERLSTKAIIETLRTHRRAQQRTLFDLFADPQHAIVDQHLRAYEHRVVSDQACRACSCVLCGFQLRGHFFARPRPAGTAMDDLKTFCCSLRSGPSSPRRRSTVRPLTPWPARWGTTGATWLSTRNTAWLSASCPASAPRPTCICWCRTSRRPPMRNAECGMRNEAKEAGEAVLASSSSVPHSAFRIPHSALGRPRKPVPVLPQKLKYATVPKLDLCSFSGPPWWLG